MSLNFWDDVSVCDAVEESVLELSNDVNNSSILTVPSLLVSSAEKTSLVLDVLELSEDAEEESLGGGIPPGGGGGIPPSCPWGFEFLSAVISSSELMLPSLLVSSLLKTSVADVLFVSVLFEFDASACAAALNSALSIEPLLSVSIELCNFFAKSSKLGLSVCFVEDVAEEL